MRILITGAAGFLGSHLVDRFLADTNLFIVRSGQTLRSTARQAIEQLGRVRADISGVVLTDVPAWQIRSAESRASVQQRPTRLRPLARSQPRPRPRLRNRQCLAS